MRKIPLTRGKFALVDDDYYARLSKYKWHAWTSNRCSTFYAQRKATFIGLRDTNTGRLGRNKFVFVMMARQIMGLCSDDPRVVDHINHNGLDNQRRNLRICTPKQNQWNSRSSEQRKGKYKGLYKTRPGKWQVYVGKRYIGLFGSEIDAAKAYDEAAIAAYGEYACLNFPESKGKDGAS